MAAGLHTEFGQLRVKDHMTESIHFFLGRRGLAHLGKR